MEFCSDTNPELPWFALHVKHKHEKRVCLSLAGKELHVLLPTYRKTHNNGLHFDLPIFSGYVFCRMDSSKSLSVLSTPGVFRILSSESGADSIPKEEIDAIRHVTSSEASIKKSEYLPPGREVYVQSGPFRGLRGVIVESNDQQWLTVSIHLLQRSVAVKLERPTVSSWT